jgi:exodeoxyribonuclease V alpha subunit
MEPIQQALEGVVERFIYKNEQTGYAVGVLQIKNNASAIITGFMSTINPGEHVSLMGTWINHAKFGRQFDVKQCVAKAPETITGLKKYLGSGLIKGIGPVYAEKLVDCFGLNVLEVIDKTPERLQDVPGIGAKRHDQIMKAWVDQKHIASVMVFLQEKGVSTAYAVKIYKKWGHESLAFLKENPYRLAEEVWGIGFKTADKIAQNLGFERHSLKRIKAGILFFLHDITTQGHLYNELQEVKTKVCELLEIEFEEQEVSLRTALHELHTADKIKVITHETEHLLALSVNYSVEKSVAKKLKALVSFERAHQIDSTEVYARLRHDEQTSATSLHEDQQRAVLAAFQEKVVIITGGPGTGKTTVVKNLLALLDEYKLSYQLAAPTGRAAKRMFESTHKPAVTIHRLLEFDASTMRFVHDETNALKTDFLIVDEASMIDIFLAHALLKAVSLKTHLILIGDVDQLPSVGAGNFLRDLIASSLCTTVHLTHIFRQAQDSLIIVNAHRVNQGEFPTTMSTEGQKDFVYIKEENPENLLEHVHKVFKKILPFYHIKSDDAIVLVPMNRGIVGTQALNHHLQNFLNSGTQGQLEYHGTLFKCGDRVMQIRNNYDKLVFNGDIGCIEEIQHEDKTMTVSFFERIVLYEFDELSELMLAYAVTIHKSQGSEYPAVIIPLFMQHFMLLQRNLLYTAITRAKRLCILIGQPKAIAMAVKNNKSVTRKTLLKEFLTTELACR